MRHEATLVSLGLITNQKRTREDPANQGQEQLSGSVHEGKDWEVEENLLERAGIRTHSRVHETQGSMSN